MTVEQFNSFLLYGSLFMAIQKLNIEDFIALSKQHPLIDVRSPGEYKHAHIPGAYSLPLFTDEERKVVGTTYKQKSREDAIKIGLDYFGPKMRLMVEEIESLVDSRTSLLKRDQPAESQDSRLILIYCWRGGMRSAGVAWLLDLYGFKVYTLIGGYKKFRNYVLETFRLPFQYKLLGGYTGSGKTDVIKQLRTKGERVIDLEDLAHHKGSAFGNIGLPQQPTQEMFENQLSAALRHYIHLNAADSFNSPESGLDFTIWLEDESQRIGLVNIPNELWKNMRKSPVYFLDIPFEERLEYLVREYGNLDKERMQEAIGRIREKLGGQNAKEASQLLEEGNTIESFRILLKYYDKLYLKALHNREVLNSLLLTVECKSVTPENASQPALYHQFQPQKL